MFQHQAFVRESNRPQGTKNAFMVATHKQESDIWTWALWLPDSVGVYRLQQMVTVWPTRYLSELNKRSTQWINNDTTQNTGLIVEQTLCTWERPDYLFTLFLQLVFKDELHNFKNPDWNVRNAIFSSVFFASGLFAPQKSEFRLFAGFWFPFSE